MTSHTFILATLCLLAASCTRTTNPNPKTACHGKVIEYTSLKPIPHTQVEVYIGSYASSNSSCNARYIKTITTDTQGIFNLYLPAPTEGSWYALVPKHPRYQGYDGFYNIDPSTRSYIGANLVLKPYVWVKAHIKNTNPHNAQDILEISYNKFLGKAIDTTVVFDFPYDFPEKNISAIIYKNAKRTYIKFPYQPITGDTTSIDIFY
jgi:hypothetical protein